MRQRRIARAALCLFCLHVFLDSTAKAENPPAFLQNEPPKTCGERLKACEDVLATLKRLDSAQKKKIGLLEKVTNKAALQPKPAPQSAIRVQGLEVVDVEAVRRTLDILNSAIRPDILRNNAICEELLKSSEKEIVALKALTVAQQKKIELLEKPTSGRGK